MAFYRLGLDVGGTNTDAVLIDASRRIIAGTKAMTTPDVFGGITAAVRELFNLTGVSGAQVSHAMLGTTHGTNAIIERKGLVKVGLLRIGAPATLLVRPLLDWPDDLTFIVEEAEVIRGGFEYDGREITAFDAAAAREFFERLCGKAEAVCISCAFSTVRQDHELAAATIARDVLGSGIPVTISSEIGSMGLIERENASVLNAALQRVGRVFTEGFAASLEELGVKQAALYLSQNDGTIMDFEHARRYPILTVACGPTNSIRGAGFLSGNPDAVVIDIGGTTTDVGVIQHGFPRESSSFVRVGGVHTNFRMPDILSVGLGGGSIVRVEGSKVSVGPDSVGHELTSRALVFGGDTLTATDIAVRAGLLDLGDASLVRHIDSDLAKAALASIIQTLEDAIDAVKTKRGDVDVILVGGGSALVSGRLSGARTVVKPEHFAVANAIGAGIGKVSGSLDRLISFEQGDRTAILDAAKQEAIDAAVKAGAACTSVEVVDLVETPLAYHPNKTSRVQIKAAGDLA
jgi:N-methylhydantoinase A/oxoprolinase/acetone carboxylase beta subunit